MPVVIYAVIHDVIYAGTENGKSIITTTVTETCNGKIKK